MQIKLGKGGLRGWPRTLLLQVTPSAATSAEVSGQRQDDFPSIIPKHERGKARKHGGVEQAIYATHAAVASAVKVAGRFAPRVERGFDASTLCWRHAFPFDLGEWYIQPSVYHFKDILDGHSGRVVGCDNPILREEVGDDMEGRDTGVRGQLSQMVG